MTDMRVDTVVSGCVMFVYLNLLLIYDCCRLALYLSSNGFWDGLF